MAEIEEVMQIFHKLAFRLRENDGSEMILLVFYYSGESFLVDDKIVVDFGCGLFSLEKLIDNFC